MINVNPLPKYPCIIQQTDIENTQTYQVEAAILIYHQALITNLQENAQPIEGIINNHILGVKGLRKKIVVQQMKMLWLKFFFLTTIFSN